MDNVSIGQSIDRRWLRMKRMINALLDRCPTYHSLSARSYTRLLALRPLGQPRAQLSSRQLRRVQFVIEESAIH
jgi:hypothetical protein